MAEGQQAGSQVPGVEGVGDPGDGIGSHQARQSAECAFSHLRELASLFYF